MKHAVNAPSVPSGSYTSHWYLCATARHPQHVSQAMHIVHVVDPKAGVPSQIYMQRRGKSHTRPQTHNNHTATPPWRTRTHKPEHVAALRGALFAPTP
jgi:hypothetical protein